MTYKLVHRRLIGIKGDPAWPYPVYEYKELDPVSIDAPVHVGETVDGQVVKDIRHNSKDGTILVVD